MNVCVNKKIKQRMSERINIAELLKGCPSGMELDCTICNGTVAFEGIVEPAAFPIRVVSKSGFHHMFTKHGFLYDDEESKCVIFPKGKDSWEGFTPPIMFKDGDVVSSEDGRWLAITAGGISTDLVPAYCLLTILNNNNLDIYETNRCFHFDRLATEAERKKLHKAINDAGFRWNAEEKRLEKLEASKPAFKDGDVVATDNGGWIFIFESPGAEKNNCHVAYDAICDNICLARSGWVFTRHATEEEAEKLFNALAERGYVWNAEEKRLEEIPAFKDGDVVATDNGDWIGITAGGISGEFMPTYCVLTERKELRVYPDYREEWMFNRLATKREKEKLFGALGAAGYVWNDEEKRLDVTGRPEFKDGDVVAFDTDRGAQLFIYKEPISPGLARCYMMLDWDGILDIYSGKYFVSRRATKEEAEKLFKAINRHGLIWNAGEKRVENMPEPKKFDPGSLKPFDKVLVRTDKCDVWECDFFSSYSTERSNRFHLIGAWHDICIPFEGNEHLLGTTDDCDDFYKTWDLED